MRYDYISSMTQLRHWFNWLPAPLSSILLLVIAALVAGLFGGVFTNAIPRIPGLKRFPIVSEMTRRLRGASRMLLMLIAAGAALPAATGLSEETLYMLGKIFAFLFILILGFGGIRAFQLATDSYLVRIAKREAHDDISVRSHQTQIRVLRRLIVITVGVITIAASLMVFDAVRRYGVSLFASAGAASLIVGLSARPALTNLLAGMQIAITQPIRMEDMLILNGDWAWVEEINATYVVLRTWDKRRYIVPIAYFLENPFQNWTHSSPALIGSVFLWLDYRTPMDRLRQLLDEEIVHCRDWDRNRANLACQVADSNAHVISIRITAGTASATGMWNLCCEVRERLLKRIREELPECIPRGRMTMMGDGGADAQAWPEGLMAPQINRPDGGSYRGPDIKLPARCV